jgi:hypothetical protein
MTMSEQTHTVPVGGLPTWPSPDAALPQGPSLASELDVKVLEWWGDWARVECSNGWIAWVDGRYLLPIGSVAAAAAGFAAAPAMSAPALDTSPVKVGAVALSVPLVGAAAALIAAFLPWISTGPVSENAMNLPITFLFDYETTETGGLKIGWVVIALAALAVALCVRPENVPAQARRAVGWGLVLIPTVYVAQLQRAAGTLQTGSVFSLIGFGVYIALGAGLCVAMGKFAKP